MAKPIKLPKKEILNQFLKDPDRKSMLKIFEEVISLGIYHKSIPRHYFSRYLFKKNKNNIKDYYPNKFLASLKPFFIKEADIDVVENKLYFDFFYRQFNISIPIIFMYNHEKIFFIEKNSFEINTVLEFKLHLNNIFKQHALNSIFIKKTSRSHGGENIYKISSKQLTSDHKDISKIFHEVIKAGFIFQETIKQHIELDLLNPSCLNTIRFDTFIDSEGKIEIISAYIRMSINNAHVDNASSGGCYVGINLKNGHLKKEAYATLSLYGVELLKAHPKTNVVFENFNIPYFNQAKELVIRVASYTPGLRLMGWDVAISESGPVLIEGNSRYNATGNDLTIGGYRSNNVFKKILDEINY